MKDENLDLLDLDDADVAAEDSLPEAAPFVAPRPHRPWLLMGIGVAIIVLAVFVIIRVVGNNSSSSIDIDLGEPIVVGERTPDVVPEPVPVPQPQPIQIVPVPTPVQPTPAPMPRPMPMPEPQQVVQQPAPAPVVAPVAPVPQQDSVRVVNDRPEVTFNPARENAAPKPIPAPAPKQAKTPAKPKPAPKPAPQKVANGGWYVQFGSYGTRAAAEAAEKKIRSGHANLFNGKQFVILAAVLPNGQTTYRLRVAFATVGDANGFCRNAKSDGLDCYVAK